MTSTLVEQSCINQGCSAVLIKISNLPVNFSDISPISGFDNYLTSLEHQTKTREAFVPSHVPGFCGPHLNLNLHGDVERPWINVTQYFDTSPPNTDLLTDLPVIFTGKIDGQPWRAANENAVRYDMRFAGPGSFFGTPEAAGGLLRCGGVQQPVQLIGPGLVTEYLPVATEVNATEAVRVGRVNLDF